jgi:hypothetical protein
MEQRCTSDASTQLPDGSAPVSLGIDLSLADLRARVAKVPPSPAYVYVIRTVGLDSQRLFRQRGTAPNMEGGLITLCTCKHHLRTYRTPQEWVGLWIAGFARSALSPMGNPLVYLMRVGQAAESHLDLWRSLPDAVREAKAADRHLLGDIYRPREAAGPGDALDPSSYQPPCDRHSHAADGEWHKDICYVARGKRAALLAGEAGLSFLFRSPSIILKGRKLGRGQVKYASVLDLVGSLEDVE